MDTEKTDIAPLLSKQIDPFSIIESLDQYVYLKDVAGKYIYANQSFCNLGSFKTLSALVGRTDYEMPWASQAKQITEEDNQVLAGKSIHKDMQTQKRKSGSVKILISKMPFKNNAGDLVGILGHFIDLGGHLLLETKGTFDEKLLRLHLENTDVWLTFKEIQVCFYLLHGFSVKRIAEKTGRSEISVRYHIKNIKDKLQCESKNDIPETAMKTGIAWTIFTLQHTLPHININEKNG